MITIRIDEKEPTLVVVAFPEDPVGNNLIREIPGRRWSYSRRCWLLPNTRDSVVKIGKLFGKAYCRFDEAVVRLYKPDASHNVIESAANPLWPPQQANAQSKPFRYMPPVLEYDQHPIIIAVCNALRIGNYSYRTLKNYKQALIALIRYAGSIPLDELTRAQYQAYLLFLTEKKRLSSATINVHINAYKFYQEKVLQRDKLYFDINYPRQLTKLPTVYSVDEVRAIVKATTSLKYRTLFRLIYSTSLRLSEAAHLCLADLDRDRRLIMVRAGKDKKDRVVMLSENLTWILIPT